MSEFKFVEKKSNLKISFERIAFIFFIFFIISLLFSAKILFLSYNDLPEQKIIKKKENFRSSIIDREGDILAKSVRITNLGIDPKLVVDKKKLLLSETLNDKILGPVNAPIYRVRRKYRQRLLIRSKKGSNIQKRLSEVLIKYKLPKEIKLTVDVDPITFN